LESAWEQHASVTAVPAGFPGQGCPTITEGEILLMNSDKPASLDSRYFYEHASPLQI
jgi:type IV secretory pathway protease TraF